LAPKHKKKTRGFTSRFSFCFPLLRSHHPLINRQMLPSYGAKRSRVVSKKKNSLKRLFFVCESLRSDFSSEVYREKNKSAPESVSPAICSHKGEEFLQIIIPQNALSPLLENPKRCVASFEDPGRGALP